MAEVVAAFGALSCFLQVVDFTAKLASTAVEFARSGRDTLREDIVLERLALEYQAIGEECAHGYDSSSQNVAQQSIIKLGKECQQDAGKLLSELQKLKLDACNSTIKRWVKGTKQAARAMAHRKAIQNQRQSLQELNNLLATQMLVDLWKQNSVISTSVSDPTSRNADNVNEVRLVLARKRIHNILESLKFPEMPSRERAIEIAWTETYSWALQDTSNGFANWLRHEHGIFWISGKAGSGKSTLMKYLCRHEDLRKLLLMWSGDRELIFARFFFWYAGTRLQKSITGLLQSILYQILYEVPTLSSIALPGHDHSRVSLLWTDEELNKSLEAILMDRGGQLATSKKSFCFFIDGLDEYEGDHARLASLLLAFDKCVNVKMCVSSRPWNAFVRAFETRVPSLRLENLTRPYIELYTSDRIKKALEIISQDAASDVRQRGEVECLIRDIADRAEGVFLWVVLAVHSVSEGMTEGDNIAMLRYRVSCLPQDLDDFFRSILDRVDRVYVNQTYQALKLAWMWIRYENLKQTDQLSNSTGPSMGRQHSCSYHTNSEIHGGHSHENHPQKRPEDPLTSFIDYWLIRRQPEGLANTEFAFVGNVRELSREVTDQMWRETRVFLSATCKDLLCLPWESVTHSMINAPRVEFLHRTVYDFLSTPEMQRSLDLHVPQHFRSWRILHLLNLKRLKYAYAKDAGGTRMFRWESSAIMSLTSPHEDLCDRYVDQFHCIGELYQQQNFHPGLLGTRFVHNICPLVLVPLIAFQQYGLAWTILDTTLADIPFGEMPDQDVTGRDSAVYIAFEPHIWDAVIGESPLNPFPVENINVHVVQRLLELTRSTGGGTTVYTTSSLISSVRQKFLDKWHMTSVPYDGHALSPSAVSKHALEVANLFAQYDTDDNFSRHCRGLGHAVTS